MATLLPALVSLLFLALGAYVLVSRGANRLTVAFAILCGMTFSWQFIWSMMLQSADARIALALARFGYLFVLFLPTAYYYFVVELTRKRDEMRWVGVSFAFACGLVALLAGTGSILAGTWRYGFGYYPRAGLLHPLHVLQTLVLTVRVPLLLYRCQRRAAAVVRVRLRYCLASVLIFALATVDYLCNYGIEFYPPGSLFVALSLGLIAQAIARHDLLANPMKLAATVVHEMRTPLATIAGQARFLVQNLPELIDGYEAGLARAPRPGPIDARGLDYLRELGRSIEAEVRRSNFIAELVLAQARGNSLERADYVPCSMRDCVEEALACYPFEGRMRERVRLGRTEDCEFSGSRTLLVFVLYNLIKNALAAVRASEGGIEIAYYRDGETCRLEVRDSGRGIAPHVLPHVFDPFYTTHPSGTGMGLAFCRRVIVSFGGTIACASREGEFTQVSVELPRCPGGAAGPGADAGAQKALAKQGWE